MNRRIIEKILENKFKDFLSSIKDKTTKELVEKNSIITGGSIVSLLLNEPVNDYDIYFTNIETCIKVADYYIKEFIKKNSTITPEIRIKDNRVKIFIKSTGIVEEKPKEDFKDLKFYDGDKEIKSIEKESKEGQYRPIFISANAITLSTKIQLVIRFYGEAEEIHKNYDFIHCCNYWESKTKKLTLNPKALEAILTKQLLYQGSLYPVCSIIRLRKFLKQGWHVNAGTILKILFQVSELNLTDIKVLEEQLTGVDALYFSQAIYFCKKKQEEDLTFQITLPYLVEIIDRIFN